MLIRRSLRRRLAGWLALAILFTQVATAAYACPAQQTAASAVMTMNGLPCPDGMAADTPMDADLPGLCHAHCHADDDQQRADPPQPQAALAARVLLFAFDAALAPATMHAAPWAAHERNRQRTPAEPHSLLHCVYRL